MLAGSSWPELTVMNSKFGPKSSAKEEAELGESPPGQIYLTINVQVKKVKYGSGDGSNPAWKSKELRKR